MFKKILNVLYILLIVIILGLGLFVTFDKDINLKERILDLVEIPANIFSYIEKTLGTSQNETVTEEVIGYNKNETEIIFFGEDEEEKESTAIIINPNASDINELPFDRLEDSDGE